MLKDLTVSSDPLPRTTERPARECGDEPHSNSAIRERCIPYPARLERGECSGVAQRAAPKSHGQKSVGRGLQTVEKGPSAVSRPESLSQVRCDRPVLRSTEDTLDASRPTHRPFEIPPGRRL